ncbi:MAG: hypothetical protein K2P94_14345 [Rhodospirillaceae bacterium]|nr:hypothetical protein [Rhodospirillaceae bacterium]
MPRPHRYAGGFGIIEFAVAIIILGMVFLFALRGTTLIAPLRSYVVAQQINQYRSAVLQYQADLMHLPGDDSVAPDRWGRPPALFSMLGSTISSAGNGKIDGLLDDSANASGEQYMAWRDLRLGGYVEGDKNLVGQSARPENTYGGVFGFAADNFGVEQVLCLTKVPGTDAALLDKRLDDGSISAGRLQGTSRWDPVDAHNHFEKADTAAYDPEKTYIICLPYLP